MAPAAAALPATANFAAPAAFVAPAAFAAAAAFAAQGVFAIPAVAPVPAAPFTTVVFAMNRPPPPPFPVRAFTAVVPLARIMMLGVAMGIFAPSGLASSSASPPECAFDIANQYQKARDP
jgi:hypothetical protein